MRPYEVDVHGVKVTVSVVPGNARLVDEKILWLKSQQQRNRVMGTELKFSMSIAKMFLVCTDSRCLIIPRLDDTSALTCMIQNTAVELGYLAAMVLKKPSLEKKGLYELADEIGVDVKPLTGAFPDLNSEVFSKEEIKNAVHDVYGSYLVGNKILACFNFWVIIQNGP
ncbi:transcription factor bHLH149-like [Pyrus ussuriensis x Pyrus communis]|uniref:Transcription factor bHLH149-like n=1 Tax=Pyrus ussuriensis x Pyrus communis TaxID=2448454 RepID=A0A5N5HVN5_9ROSA|nr:transcription factor bHLH149-like [Pyrus ussuriensis x Pyrus communis]